MIDFQLDRRKMLAGLGAASAVHVAPAIARAGKVADPSHFPAGFLWGASVSGYQTEGSNVGSDIWLLENVKPSLYRERSGDACNSFALWEQDLEIAKSLGLTSYRFSLEWSRIEPEPGLFSLAALDHYRRILDRLVELGITPIVTFHHFSAPRWFAARNGWLGVDAAMLFARFCERAARHLADRLDYVVTINEPNIEHVLKWGNLPPELQGVRRAMRAAAASACGSTAFAAFTSITVDELDRFRDGLLAGHKAGREAIRSACPKARIGLSLSVNDDQAVGSAAMRDAKRQDVYAPFLAACAGDDFVGVQNYERSRVGANGQLPAPEGAVLNQMGQEVYPLSLAHAARYVHGATGLRILVTEHGVATEDDALRARFIRESLIGLKAEIDRGLPVLGYAHWSLLDNFEWIFGYGPKLGLVAVDRKTFARTVKPSASAYAQIIRQNSV